MCVEKMDVTDKVENIFRSYIGDPQKVLQNILGRVPNRLDETLLMIDGLLVRSWEVSPGMTKQRQKLLQAKKEMLDIIKTLPPEPIPTNDEEDW